MRTKIGKRIGPVPITLAVAVLVALAAFVVIQTNAAFAQERIPTGKGCGVEFENSEGVFAIGTFDAAVKGEDCITTEDELTVTFRIAEGETADADADTGDIYVYRIGGNVGSMRAQMPYGFSNGGGNAMYDDVPLSTVIREEQDPDVEFADRPMINRTDEVGGSMMSKVGRTAGRNVEVEVTRRQADANGRVFLFVYTGEQEDVPFATAPTEDQLRPGSCMDTDTDGDSYIDLGSDGTSITVRRALCEEDAGDPGTAGSAIPQTDPLVVQIDFLGEPSAKEVCGTEEDPEECSSLTVKTHEDDSVAAPIDGTAKVTAMFRDSQGRPLPGFVSFEVMGDADVLIEESNLKTHRGELGEDAVGEDAVPVPGVTEITVLGLPESDSDDPYKIAISAMLQSDAGTHTFNTSISRIGDADMVTAMTYRCDPDGEVDAVAAEPEGTPVVVGVIGVSICETEAEALAKKDIKDPSPATVFAPESYFLIHSTAMDSLGQDKKDDVAFAIAEQPAEGESAEFDDLAEVKDADDARILGSGQNGFFTVMVPDKDNIETGSYSFEIVADAGDAMTTVTITVAGEPMAHEVTGSDRIALNGIETYTVSVTDENGNPPVLPTKAEQMDDMCQITIKVETSVADTIVQTTGLDSDDCLVIDPNTGMGSFKVLAPFGAAQDDAVRITALRGNDAEILTVTLGDPPTEPGTIDPGTMDELTAPMNVDASYVPLTGSISMNWTEGQGANRQMVVLLGSGSAVVYNMTVKADASVHDIRTGNDGEALMPGEYRLFVLSISGSNFEPSAAFAITVPAN